MHFTEYHARYFALDITKRRFADNIEKIIPSLFDSRVDLKPHQIEASLFAFKSPFSKGAILADEVGLGKTIEAGLVLSQNWAERKRRLLIIAPASLRKQWSEELLEKFFLHSTILETKSFNDEIKKGKFNPFDCNKIVITSYNFAKLKSDFIVRVPWDLVVIDEAHRLRNVYKSDNKTAKAIKEVLSGFKKVLLTATPLQNSLLELFGLVSIIDENVFGDISSYKARYVRGGDNNNGADYFDLRERLKPICMRSLRRQVAEYINYTKRNAITQQFTPYDDEDALYKMVDSYLARSNLFALPNSQRQLITLIMRKLLASSSFAIADTLSTLITRLEMIAKQASRHFPLGEIADSDFSEIYLSDEETEDIEETIQLSPEESSALNNEIADLKSFLEHAKSIKINAKGESLLLALGKGFEKLEELGARKKAVIFTESRRTQEYVNTLLTDKGYNVVLFNGSNTDKKSKSIYHDWVDKHKGTNAITGSLTSDRRAALVEYFRDTADIMLATEAAAEGINLQFCSLVVNYDMPWNPQRIEQRIGRCHRYGQKYDVVVINFLNVKNAADVRVYQLLDEKFRLFSGVFGASDEVLGAIESGVDFEKRINHIYQNCRTLDEIEKAFDALQKEMENHIVDMMKITRQKLLENFDEEVHEKLRISLANSQALLNRYEKELWSASVFALTPYADFDDKTYTFELIESPPNINGQCTGRYKLGKIGNDGAIPYGLHLPVAQFVIEKCLNVPVPTAELVFDLTGSPVKISILEPYKGQSGELALYNIIVNGVEPENYLVFAAITDEGVILDSELCERFFSLSAERGAEMAFQYEEKLYGQFLREQGNIKAEIEKRNTTFFSDEMGKLDKWADDLKTSLEMQLKQLDIDIKTLKAESRKTVILADKLAIETQIKDFEARRNNLRHNLYEEQDRVDEQKERLIDEVEKRLTQTINTEMVFGIRWRII